MNPNKGKVMTKMIFTTRKKCIWIID